MAVTSRALSVIPAGAGIRGWRATFVIATAGNGPRSSGKHGGRLPRHYADGRSRAHSARAAGAAKSRGLMPRASMTMA